MLFVSEMSDVFLILLRPGCNPLNFGFMFASPFLDLGVHQQE